MISHQPERPFKCNLCDKAYRKRYELKAHRATHLEESPHVCHICNKSFKRKLNLAVHIRIHDSNNRVPCRHCGELFVEGYIKKHELTHTIERPYTCEICQKPIFRKWYYNVHRKECEQRLKEGKNIYMKKYLPVGVRWTKKHNGKGNVKETEVIQSVATLPESSSTCNNQMDVKQSNVFEKITDNLNMESMQMDLEIDRHLV